MSGAARRFFRKPGACLGLAILAAQLFCVLLLPVLLGLDPNRIDLAAGFWAAPSPGHPLGTDEIGRDLLARLLFGGRASLLVGFGAGGLAVFLGVPLGLLSGYFRGWWEAAILRVADVLLSFPSLVLTLAVCSLFGGSLHNIILMQGLLNWPHIARPIYANALTIREREYVLAARSIGAGHGAILLRHVAPNASAPVWATAPLRVGRAILAESGLSFLGAGLRPPQASWGSLLGYASGLTVLTARPWVWLPPGAMIVLTVLACQLVADALREANSVPV